MTKSPTPTDLKIFAHLEKGNKINAVSALRLFKTVGLRDVIYRLRSAEYPIDSEWVSYKTADGVRKIYKSYFIKSDKAA